MTTRLRLWCRRCDDLDDMPALRVAMNLAMRMECRLSPADQRQYGVWCDATLTPQARAELVQLARDLREER
jgi:hypothetical protein